MRCCLSQGAVHLEPRDTSEPRPMEPTMCLISVHSAASAAAKTEREREGFVRSAATRAQCSNFDNASGNLGVVTRYLDTYLRGCPSNR